MTNIEQGLRSLRKHRYSIKQLLALSGTAYNPFDLSKFTFDAARAGVIPSLDDCGMASRKSSASRPRDVSSGSAGALQGVTAEVEGGYMPTRRPEPPPGNAMAQHHTGFARFLKKHSSPTHRRVTAGGRIVPMEPHFAPPPPFSLTVNEPSRPEGRSRLGQQAQSKAVETNKDMAGFSLGQPRSITSLQPAGSPTSNQHANASSERDQQLNDDLRAQDCNPMNPSVAESGNMTSYPTQARSSEVLPMHYPNYAVGCPIMHNPWQTICPVPDLAVQSAISTWQYGHNMMPPSLQAHVYNPGQFTQPILWAQSTLSDWTQRYNELDQQLKALDRHRAMTNLTSDIASQRREIVQHRSDTKNMINLISTWLNMSEQVQPGLNTHSLGSTFNVEAPAYIPMAHQTTIPESSTIGAQESDEVHNKPAIRKPPPRAERRPIAIVAPPNLQTNFSPAKEANSLSPESPELDSVDAWGVKLGPAPPELQRQQSEILESISEAQSQSSHSNHSQESLQPAPQGGFFQQYNDTVLPDDTASQGSDEHGLAQVPADIEAMYEEGLDALRKPKGNVTAVKMPDGSLVDVEGQDLQRPSPAIMSEFEKDYWLRKPALPQFTASDGDTKTAGWSRRITTTPVSQVISSSKLDLSSPCHSGKSSGKENIAVTPIIHRKAATDMFLTRFNDTNSSDEVQPRPYQPKSLLVRKSSTMVREQHLSKMVRSTHRHDVNNQGSLGYDVYTNGSSIDPRPARLDDHSLMTTSRNVPGDGYNNKGFSMTSVQNVHAVAHWPQTLDGTADCNKERKSRLSLAGKIKSPRLLRRTTANSGA